MRHHVGEDQAETGASLLCRAGVIPGADARSGSTRERLDDGSSRGGNVPDKCR